jgi:hypothetical protein
VTNKNYFRLRFLLLLLLLLHGGYLGASGDGPRVHGPAPVGVNILTFHASALKDANRSFDPSLVTPRLKFDTSIGTIYHFKLISRF